VATYAKVVLKDDDTVVESADICFADDHTSVTTAVLMKRLAAKGAAHA
jgi:hypothetical protein